MLDEVGDEGSFGSTRGALARREAGTEGLAPRDADGNVRAEFGEGFAVVVEVDALEKLLDARIVSLCVRPRESAMGR